MKKFNPKRLLALAYFWCYGIIVVAFILPIIVGLIFFNNEFLHTYTAQAISISIGLPFCAKGIDDILGCIFKFDHIILVNQSSYRQKMNPYNLIWNVSKKEFIAIGVIFLCLGLSMIVLSFFI
jgi:hypothetical protein